MTISLPIKAFLGGLAIIVYLASAAQAGRPLIHSESTCKAVQEYYGSGWGGRLTWGGTGNYKTKGCYYYENGKHAGTVWYSTGGVLWTQNANTGDGKSSTGKRRFDALCHKNTTYWHVKGRGTNYVKNAKHAYPRRTMANWGWDEISCDCSEKEMVQGSLGNVSGKCTGHYYDGSG